MKNLLIKWMQNRIQKDAKHNTLLSRHAPFWATVSVVCIALSVIGFSFDWSVLYGFIYNATGAAYAGAAAAGVLALIIQVMIVGGTSLFFWSYSRRLHQQSRWKLQMYYAGSTAAVGLVASLYLSWHTDTAVYAIAAGKSNNMHAEIIAQQKSLSDAMQSGANSSSKEFHSLRAATNEDFNKQADAVTAKFQAKIDPYVKRKKSYVADGKAADASWIQKKYIDRYNQQMKDELAKVEVSRQKALSVILSTHDTKMRSVASASGTSMEMLDQLAKDRIARFESGLQTGATTMRGFNITINLLVAVLTAMIIVFFRDAEQDIKTSHSPTPRSGGGGGNRGGGKDHPALPKDFFANTPAPEAVNPPTPEHVSVDTLRKETVEGTENTKAKPEINFADNNSSPPETLPKKVVEPKPYERVDAKVVMMIDPVVDYTYHVKNCREHWRNAHKITAKKETTIARLDKVRQHAAVLMDSGYNILPGDRADRLCFDKKGSPTLPKNTYTCVIDIDPYGRPVFGKKKAENNISQTA